MDSFHLVIAALAGAVASGVNAIAGGGMLIAFPAAVAAGLPPLLANATSTAGLLPGSVSSVLSYRRHLLGSWPWTRSWALVSVIGGSVGALLLVRTPAHVFSAIVPFLILFATVVFAFPPANKRPLQDQGPFKPRATLATQLGVAVYGGYFGAGAGFVMLALLHELGIRDIHRMNGLKLVAGVAMNAAAVLVFAYRQLVVWPVALALAIGATLGGNLVASIAQRIPTKTIRVAVIVIGLSSAFWLFASGDW